MFVMGCQDASTNVAEAALSATSSLIKELGRDQEVMALQCVINPMLAVMSACLRNGSDDTVIEGLDVIQEACLLEQPLVNDHLEVIVQFSLSILQTKEYESGVKQSAGQTLINIIEFRPKLLAKKNLVGPVLATLMEMIAKQDSSAAGSLFSFNARDGILGDESDDDEDEPEMDVQRLAQTTIDCMAINVPSKYFVEPALALCAQGMSSPDSHMRKAGCAVLGVIAEGCSDRIRESLDSILPLLLQLVQDPEFYVRECACFALGQFSEHCQPDILHHNETVLPVIFQALDDPRPTVQGTSCYVLEYFCESLQPATLRPYLNPLMTRLANLLQSSQKSTQEMALTAIAATAVAAEIDFLPYTETICGILGNLIFSTEPNMFAIRGRALECLGHIAVAIGDTYFVRYFESGMQSATQGIQLNDESLKEHSFVFIANCAKVMHKAFEPYMPSLVPYLLEVISESELVLLQPGEDGEDEDADEEGEGADEDGNYRVHVEEGFINAKKAALTALGALAEHTNELFYPYLGNALETLMTEDIGAIYSLHEVIRAEALSITQYMVSVALKHNGINDKPKFGEVLALNEISVRIVASAMSAFTACLLTDDDKLPVSYATEATVGVLRQVGVVALQLPGADNTPIANNLMKAIHQILAEKAPCQEKYEGDAENEEDEDDHDNLVMDAITDLIGELAKVLGANFVVYFDEFQKLLLKFTKPSRAHTDRSMAIGCYAEVIAEIGPASLKYVDLLMPMIQAGLADTMEGVRRNSAFCIGTLVQSTGTAMVPHFLNMLQWLHPVCLRKDTRKTSDTGGADVDNALAAVARLITAAHTAVPLAHVLPVVLAALPLREDTSEGPIIYQCFAQLLHVNDPTAVSMVAQLVAAFGETLTKSSTAIDETKAVSVAILKHLVASAQFQPVVMAYLAQVADAEDRNTIQQALST